MGRALMWIALLAFAASWFLPVHQQLEPGSVERTVLDAFRELGRSLEEGLGREVGPAKLGDTPSGADRYGGPPGWQAMRFAWDLLRGEDGGSDKGSSTKRVLLGLTSVTNVAMLLTALVLFLSLRGVPRLLGVLLLACAVLNFGWVYLTDAAFRDGLRLGYWMWAGSFALAGIGALRPVTA
jgi:hypothetical protein